MQPLTTASGPDLRALGVLHPRGGLTIARQGQEAELASFARRFAELGVRVEMQNRAEIAARVPGLRKEWVAGALEPDCCDIDVAALHHAGRIRPQIAAHFGISRVAETSNQ